MKKLTILLALFLTMIAQAETSHLGFAFEDPIQKLANSCTHHFKAVCSEWAELGGNGGYPHGIAAHATAELAVGEAYFLVGTVRKSGTKLMFQIDFESHPWLETTYRKASPYYPIDDSNLAKWAPYINVKVGTPFRAEGRVLRGAAREAYAIGLLPMGEPVRDYAKYLGIAQSKR